MASPLETSLLSSPVAEWVTRQAIALDWYDGPREGLCALAGPPGEFFFELLEERFNPEGLEDRLFRIKELPPGSVDRVLDLLKPLGIPETPLWVPVWKFPGETERKAGEGQLQTVLAKARPTSLVIASPDLLTFQGCWKVDETTRNGADWFSFLGLPHQQPS